MISNVHADFDYIHTYCNMYAYINSTVILTQPIILLFQYKTQCSRSLVLKVVVATYQVEQKLLFALLKKRPRTYSELLQQPQPIVKLAKDVSLTNS